MMETLSCCILRNEEEEDDQPLKVKRTITVNNVPARKGKTRLTQDQSLELEWEIIEASIEADELKRVRNLWEALRDLDSHPACMKRPLNRQAQTLVRFLRGREGNTKAAEKMFRDSMNWRTEMNIDEEIEAWNQELDAGRTQRSRFVKKYGTDSKPCLDKYGVPVWLMRMSVSDPAGILRELGKEALLIHTLSNMEAMHAHLRQAMFANGEMVRGCIQIFDVGDYGPHGCPNWWSRMWDGFRVGSNAFKIFDANYPETTRRVFVVRMGGVTHSIQQLATPLIPRRTKRKMRFFGYAAAKWVSELRDECDPDAILPEFLTEDTDAAFASARPKGGLVLEGDTFEESDDKDNSVLKHRVAAPSKSSSHMPAVIRVIALVLVLALAILVARKDLHKIVFR